MTAIDYMEKQLRKNQRIYNSDFKRGAPEEILRNIEKKIGYYEAAVNALKAREGK